MNKKTILTKLISFTMILAIGLMALGCNKTDATEYFGKIEVNEIDVSSKIPGRIDTLYVRLGDKITRGDTLAILESKEMDAKLEQAKSVMMAAKAKWDMARAGARRQQITAAKKLVDQAKYQFEFAESSYTRLKKLYADSVISKQKFDEISFKYNAAKAQYEAAKAKLGMVLEGVRPEEKSAAEALYHQAENAYKEALAYHDELTITAKTSGTVYSLVADQGEIISAGYPLLTIVDYNSQYALINVKETEITKIKVGDEFKGYLQALGKTITFKVYYISPLADYASWKPTSQKGEFDIRTYEVRLSPMSDTDEIRPGMNVKFRID